LRTAIGLQTQLTIFLTQTTPNALGRKLDKGCA
jgi:hypothetical protein